MDLKEYFRLTIVPDGNLHLLPFDSLIDESGKSVIESHLVTYAPSGTALHLLRNQPNPENVSKTLLAVGGVSYSRNKKGLNPSAARSLASLQASQLRPLPHTDTEVISIGKIFEKESTVLVGRDATETALKSQRLSDFKILHLAVHGFSDLHYPERTSLILAADGKSGEDGLLQDREIRDLRLSAELVTLSACDTGIGQLQAKRAFPAWSGLFSSQEQKLWLPASGMRMTSPRPL